MKDNSIDIKSFLATSPSIQDILKYVEDESQRRVKEIRAAGAVAK